MPISLYHLLMEISPGLWGGQATKYDSLSRDVLANGPYLIEFVGAGFVGAAAETRRRGDAATRAGMLLCFLGRFGRGLGFSVGVVVGVVKDLGAVG